MRKHGYSGGFAAGIIAAGGTLGILLRVDHMISTRSRPSVARPTFSRRTAVVLLVTSSPAMRCGNFAVNIMRQLQYERSGQEVSSCASIP